MMPLADFTLGAALLTVLEIFLFVAWIWVLITIFGDLFSDHTLSPAGARRAGHSSLSCSRSSEC
jgi:hypothetical protein